MTQVRRILAGYREIVVALKPRNPLACTIVKDAARSDRPVAEFIESALHCTQLPQRTHDVGVRIGARGYGCALGTRARQRDLIALLCRFWLLSFRCGRPTPRQLSSCFIAGQHRQRPDRKDRRRMPSWLQIQAVRHDRRYRSHERQRAQAVARIAQHQSEDARQPHPYKGAVHFANAVRQALCNGYFTHAFAPGVGDRPVNSFQPAEVRTDRL